MPGFRFPAPDPQMIPKAVRLREEAGRIKAQADSLLLKADELIAKAEALEKAGRLEKERRRTSRSA
jgi:hypothetical protein